MEKLILLGAGGHCKVLLDILSAGYDIIGLTDADPSRKGNTFYGFNIIGQDKEIEVHYLKGVKNALVALGGEPAKRRQLFQYASKIGFNMINSISKNSIISHSVIMKKGNSVMDGVIIHADTLIGSNNILNTGCIIEHDCVIGNHIHIAPGARIAGGVKVGDGSHIGIGASIIQGIQIGRNCVIGAGAVVIRDIPDDSLCVGIPARIVKRLIREDGYED